MFTNLIVNALVFLPLVFNNGAPVNQPAVIGIGPDEPITVTVTITDTGVVTDTPTKHIERHEAEQINVQSDGSFSALYAGNVYGGCLKTIEYVGDYPTGIIPSDCSQSTGATDGVELFEDGSAIWTVNSELQIDGCFLPSWGCSVDDSRSWLSRSR